MLEISKVINCTTYKQFLEEESKNGFGAVFHGGVYLSFLVDTPEKIMEIKESSSFRDGPNLPVLIEKLEDLIGKSVKLDNNYVGDLVSLEITNDDYYWVVRDKTGKDQYFNCISNIVAMQ